MRVKPLGKVVLFLLFLGGAYALWTQLPAQYRRWVPSTLTERLKEEMPRVTAPEPVEETAPAHEGIALGYAGMPPPALVDIADPSRANAALKQALGEAPVLVKVPGSRQLVDGLRGGALDAAVLDFPSVVYASRSEVAPFRVVLLVGWRLGADVLAVKGTGGWKPDMRTGYVAGSSSEYMVRRALGAGTLSPAERKQAESRLVAVTSPKDATKNTAAAAGRLDQLGPLPAGWLEVRTTAEAQKAERIPDVLVVREDWAREDPDRVQSLVRGWLKAQAEAGPYTAAWKKYVKAQAGATGWNPTEVELQMPPASLEDQQAFMGVQVGHPGYIDLVVEQTRATRSGGPVPPKPPSVRVDRQPLERVLAETMVG